MTEDFEPFGDLPVGQRFNLDAGIETGLLHRMKTPGLIVYVKTSARGYVRENDGSTFTVGSRKARTWRIR